MSEVALSDIIIELHVPDFDIAREFYSKFGFEEVWSYPPIKQSGYLVMKRGDSILSFFCGTDEVYEHPYFRKFPKDTPRGYATELAIYIPDMDLEKYFAEVKEKIPTESLVQPLVMKRWGTRDFRVVDPFGFYLCFRELNNILVK